MRKTIPLLLIFLMVCSMVVNVNEKVSHALMKF